MNGGKGTYQQLVFRFFPNSPPKGPIPILMGEVPMYLCLAV